MRKYKAARFPAWTVVAFGCVAALAAFGFGTYNLSSVYQYGMLVPVLGFLLAGLVTALVGFGFLGWFDLVQHFTAQSEQPPNSSLKRTNQSLRD